MIERLAIVLACALPPAIAVANEAPPAEAPPAEAPPAEAPSPAGKPVAEVPSPPTEGITATSGDAPTEPVPEPVDDSGDGETIEVVDRAPPGARAELGKEQLERDEYDDLHKVLGSIAGVYIRDEDGYGLRPNIGMRGAAADRSAKVTLMEDGVLSGPAPYTAPAAYYVPLVTRMSRIEVTKGPSSIRFGPATVGGAIDMISEPFPAERAGYADIAGGSNLYGKAHLRAAERRKRWGVMAEYVKLRTDGFKELDGGGNTGFDKDDVSVIGRYMSDPASTTYHQFDVRVGYGRERSNETYTGLTDADFAASPQRRYVASQLDQMNWDHWRLRADHRLELGTKTRVVTTAYRNRFHRAWGKVDGFVGQRDFYGLLAAPSAGTNQLYYAILTGRIDTSSPEEQLVRGTNDRSFTSQGIQSLLAAERTTGPVVHHVDAGVRIHFDRADRRRFEDRFDMVAGSLVRSDVMQTKPLDTRAETIALALFAEDRVHYKRLELSAGVRLELIDYRFVDWLTMDQKEGAYSVLIPGGGAEYHVTDQFSVLAGVHRGFVPVAPSAAGDVRPESSLNVEGGARWRDERVNADLIGFFSDYSNLKGSCTLAAGCTEAMDGAEYNGGHVRVWGAEAQAGAELPLVTRKKLTLPVALAYTYTASEFQHSFSSEFAGWGDVETGDELPYLPRHQIAVSGGVKHPRWEAGATARYRSTSRDVAGQGDIPEVERANALLTIDLSAHAKLRPWAELYATCSNLLDEQVIVARRPYGARPNPPRMIAVGYKARF
ncbi:MAG: TonB-dependent receptor [Myxococcales bacterium]|nr:TonB-dependent receptor [Myxococcales bacterium]